MALLIGADVGGTSTRVAVERDGVIVGRAEGRSGAVRPGRAMASASVIAETVRKALAEAGVLRGDVLLVGAAGVGRETERAELERALRLEAVAEKVRVTTDVAIALEAAFDGGPGVVVVAGTGSGAFGRLPDGSEIRRGGYGWQLGDEGSGYWIGRAALHALSRAEDGRGPETSLTAAVLALTKLAAFPDLIRWAATAGAPEVAALAPAVLASAETGDRVAQGILGDAATELADLVRVTVAAFPGGEPVPVALSGGLLDPRSGRVVLRDAVLKALGKVDRVAVREEAVDPVRGALRMSRGSRV